MLLSIDPRRLPSYIVNQNSLPRFVWLKGRNVEKIRSCPKNTKVARNCFQLIETPPSYQPSWSCKYKRKKQTKKSKGYPEVSRFLMIVSSWSEDSAAVQAITASVVELFRSKTIQTKNPRLSRSYQNCSKMFQVEKTTPKLSRVSQQVFWNYSKQNKKNKVILRSVKIVQSSLKLFNTSKLPV